MLWSIGSCHFNKVSTDQYHVTISGLELIEVTYFVDCFPGNTGLQFQAPLRERVDRQRQNFGAN